MPRRPDFNWRNVGMEKKYAVMVINNIFKNESMLIVKSEGTQMVRRYEENITKEVLSEYLSTNGIDIETCVINVVEEDWMGSPKISRW